MGFLDSLVLKNLAANARHTRDKGLIPGWERFPRGGNGNPLQCPYLGSPMERGAWWATVHGVTKTWTRLRGWMRARAHTHTHTHTHTRSCASLYSSSSKWFHDALCVHCRRKALEVDVICAIDIDSSLGTEQTERVEITTTLQRCQQ